jgi:hypothetical protein
MGRVQGVTCPPTTFSAQRQALAVRLCYKLYHICVSRHAVIFVSNFELTRLSIIHLNLSKKHSLSWLGAEPCIHRGNSRYRDGTAGEEMLHGPRYGHCKGNSSPAKSSSCPDGTPCCAYKAIETCRIRIVRERCCLFEDTCRKQVYLTFSSDPARCWL